MRQIQMGGFSGLGRVNSEIIVGHIKVPQTFFQNQGNMLTKADAVAAGVIPSNIANVNTAACNGY
jgi:hypothetical protein